MNEPEAAAVFAGDLADPWVAAIAGALPRASIRLDCPGDLSEGLSKAAERASLVVLHRDHPSGIDLERVRGLRERPGGPPRIVLCIGPDARQHVLERWAPLVDAIVPDAIAPEVIGRHAPHPRRRGSGERVAVVAPDFELRVYLSDACHRAGFAASVSSGWGEAPPDLPTLWIAPTLEPGWSDELAERVQGRRVIVLAGFVDRRTVRLARSRGAVACLDLPCDPADLAYVLGRVISNREGLRVDRGHRQPAGPTPAHREARRGEGRSTA